MATTEDREVDGLVQDIVDASKQAPKSRQTNIKPTVAELTSLAYERGLLPSVLDQLVDLVTKPNFLDQASLTAIVRNLYPATRVSRSALLRIVASIGHGELKPSLNVQAALLRWLILVYHALESPSVLSQSFQVLFNLLDTAAFRPQLSHLLALITRRKHVRPFRIQAILGLSRQTGNDPCLVGLLRVFKDYYPEIIVGSAVQGKASAFKHPDPEWRDHLDEIQESHLLKGQNGLPQPRDGFRVHRPVNQFRRNKLVPIVQTSRVNEDMVTLEEIESAKDLAKHLDKIELPNQLVAVLADPLLQKLAALRPDDDTDKRIANWLSAVLEDVVHGDADHDTLWEVLEVVRQYVVSTKTLPSVVLNFFATFFPLWDGTGPCETVMDIMGFVAVLPFDHLYKHVLHPLESSLLAREASLRLPMLHMYTRILRHWTSLLASRDMIPLYATDSYAGLVQHVNTLGMTLVQTSPDITAVSAMLDFYDQCMRLVTHERLFKYIRIELPHRTLVYYLLFNGSIAVTSRVCHVLAACKHGFEYAMEVKQTDDSESLVNFRTYNKEYVARYNGMLMDICNCLWRGRAFGVDDRNAQGCSIPRQTTAALTEYVTRVDRFFSLQTLFNVSYSPTLCLLSIQRVRKSEDDALTMGKPIRTRHAGPVTPTSLSKLGVAGGLQMTWQEYRIGVLDSLTDQGLPGIAELLKNTLTTLKNSMESRTPGSQLSSQGSAVR